MGGAPSAALWLTLYWTGLRRRIPRDVPQALRIVERLAQNPVADAHSARAERAREEREAAEAAAAKPEAPKAAAPKAPPAKKPAPAPEKKAAGSLGDLSLKPMESDEE